MSDATVEDPFGFAVGESLYPGSIYSIQRSVSRGGAGVVYLAHNKGIEVAIKVVAPKDDGVDLSIFERTFGKEIGRLSKISHPNISRILDYGTCIDGKASGRLFYVMEFIRGEPFAKAVASERVSASELLRLVDELLEALAFIHKQEPPILHTDVKSENVLVRHIGTRHQAILVDFGVSKAIPPAGTSGVTSYHTTKKNTRQERRHLVNTEIDFEQLRSFFPDEDLYQFGHMIRSTLAVGVIREKLRSEMDETTNRGLRLLLDRLTGPLEGQYASVLQVRRVLKSLFPEHSAPFGIPELSIASGTDKSIAVPGGRIRLTRRLVDIVNSGVFQRLRNFMQLNFVHVILPGAQHSRFLHSLYTFQLCREYVLTLLEDARFRVAATTADIEAILLLSLLHDLGHFPLSHMFEDFREKENEQELDAKIMTDDDLLLCFLFPERVKGENRKAVARVIEGEMDCQDQAKPAFRQALSAFSLATLDRLYELASGRAPADDLVGRVLRGIINSPIDADKVSYLWLDSRMSGIDYGAGIDLEGLFGGLRYPAEVDIGKQTSGILAVSDKGLSSAESIILARYWMIKRVYWHHTNRAVMSMVKFVIEGLISVGVFQFKEYIRKTLFGSDLKALEVLCTEWECYSPSIQSHFSQKLYAGQVINPIRGMLGGGRRIYKRLLTASRQGPGDHPDLYRLIATRDLAGRAELRLALTLAIGEAIGRELPAGTVLLDVPDKERETTGGRLWFYRQRADDADGHSIYESSPLLGRLRDEFDQYTKKARVFVEPELYDEWDAETLEKMRKVARRALKRAVGLEPE